MNANKIFIECVIKDKYIDRYGENSILQSIDHNWEIVSLPPIIFIHKKKLYASKNYLIH
jgi:hypothetical protein